MSDVGLNGHVIDGRYKITRIIGKGGMGIVYAADRIDGGGVVAVKVMLARDPALAQRFRREARHARGVVHPHVARVIDSGQLGDGREFIVMEYVAGTDLATLLRDEVALPVERTLSITSQILDGLAAIHDAGILHRDIKPNNVLLGERDRVKLADFGLARADLDPTLTKTGNIVGTTPYMAPELFRGDTVDARADLYAVGITLYQMLAGKLPFVGRTAEIGALHVHTPPPPLVELRSDLPGWLVSVVDRALAKSPADRFPDARAFRAALQLPRRVPRWPWLAAGVAVIVAAGTAGGWLARREVPAAILARDAALPDAAMAESDDTPGERRDGH